jgi:hypothetical protein
LIKTYTLYRLNNFFRKMINMTNNGKAIFEFTFPDDALNDDHPVFSPPFATSNETFWQLKFYKVFFLIKFEILIKKVIIM